MTETRTCLHPRAVVVRGGQLKPDERRHPSDAAWCPSCGAFREVAVGVDPDPWKVPSR